MKGLKRHITLLLVLVFCTAVRSQTIGKKDAKLLFEKMYVYLKVADERSFIEMFSTSSTKDSHQVPLTVSEIREHYTELRTFLDTALKNNIQVGDVDVDKLNSEESKEFDAKSKISTYFNYSEKYRKGISFYVDKVNDKWMLRSGPDYLIEGEAKD